MIGLLDSTFYFAPSWLKQALILSLFDRLSNVFLRKKAKLRVNVEPQPFNLIYAGFYWTIDLFFQTKKKNYIYMPIDNTCRIKNWN